MDDFFKELMEQALNEGKIVRFSVKDGEWNVALGEDIEVLSQAELTGYRAELEDRLSDMEDIKPRDLASEEFSLWADVRESLKDLISEVEDRLDELG